MPRSGPRRCLSPSSNSDVIKDQWQDQGFATEWDEDGNLTTNPDRLNQLSLLADLLAACGATHLLDLGIGSAQVEFAINNRHPTFFDHCRVTGIDASVAMLELAERRCEVERLPGVSLVQADFASINNVELDSPPDAVICVQALHEVANDVKKSVFTRVHEWLPAGRPFYVLDRFNYSTDVWLDDWCATWNWMRSNAPGDVLKFDDYHRKYSQKVDYIASVEDYQGWLENAGFKTVCPYRCFNRAMIIARD